MFELSVRTEFSAAHCLVGYDGKCAHRHGHNWGVEVFIRGAALNGTGMLLDFKELKQAVAAALDELDHRDLNELPSFMERNPTSENIARHLYECLGAQFRDRAFRVHRVSVMESRSSTATYWEEARPGD